MKTVNEILNLQKLNTLVELRLLIKPYKENISFRIDDNLFKKAFDYIRKIKNDDTEYILDIPDIGYCGILIEDQSFTKIYVNKENVILTKNEITEIFKDSRKILHNLLLKEVLIKYDKEIFYFCDVSKYNCGKKFDKCNLKSNPSAKIQ